MTIAYLERNMSRPHGLHQMMLLTLCCVMLLTGPICAQPLRVLPAGRLPDDARLGPLKDLNGYFPFFVPASRDAWQTRAAYVRRRILVSLGMWPLPTRMPLHAVVHGKIQRPDYSIEKVYFESMPGFFVTGNLYRPVDAVQKHPGILCPHGHWANGRFYDYGRDKVRKQIVEGAERFEDGGRSPLQSRCVQLARMGCVVFHWDMIGYADSQQIPSSIAHGFAKQRPAMNRAENWGLFSPQAEAHFETVMGLQTFNSIRSLDFLLSLPDVDAKRIGMTGASGGGTQTFILSAIDPRIAVSFPAVMVSTAMQGGCTCENACDLRIGTSNVEFAALFAPKPLGMTAANDWTKEMETKGFPELQQLFQMAGVPNNVMFKPLTHFGHNYNYVSRAAMYSWFNKQFHLGWKEPIVEGAYHRLTANELTVWDAAHPKPKGGPEFERKLLKWWTDDTRNQLDGLVPNDPSSLARYQKTVGDALDIVIGRRLPASDSVSVQCVDMTRCDGYGQLEALVTHRITGPDTIVVSNDGLAATAQEQLPVVALLPENGVSRVCIWISTEGKSGLFDQTGAPIAPVQQLLRQGIAVCGIDLFMQGEFLKDGKPVTRTRRVANEREAAAYTFGYNPTRFARRVHDILSVLTAIRGLDSPPDEIDLVGMQEAGPWVAAACAQARGIITRAVVDTQGFRFAKVTDLHDPRFLPGGAKYDDLPGMLAVAAPGKLMILGEAGNLPSIVRAAYQASGHADSVVSVTGNDTHGVVKWLLDN